MSKRVSRTTESFIAESVQKYGSRYTYDDCVFVNCKTKVELYDTLKNEYIETYPRDHLTKTRSANPLQRNVVISSHEFQQKSKLIHGERYGIVSYTALTRDAVFNCTIHGEYTQKAKVHLHGGICPGCASDCHRVEFINKARSKYGNKFEYGSYTSARNKMWICCRVHGWFEQTPRQHLSSDNGCSECANDAKALSQAEYEAKAHAMHGSKYSYGVYVNTITDIEITCQAHGVFAQLPKDHLQGCACPTCAMGNYSRLQIEVIEYIALALGCEFRHTENSKSEFAIEGVGAVDGFSQKECITIEVHGTFYHGHPSKYNPRDTNPLTKKTYGELYQKTINRDQKIRDLGYNHIVIWEHDWKVFKKAGFVGELIGFDLEQLRDIISRSSITD